MDFEKLRALAQEEDLAELEAIAALQDSEAAPLLLCVAGAFSTGKTSLLNRLLERELLPVALEESTALPTFVEWAERPVYNIVFETGPQPANVENLESLIRTPPAGARFLDIGLPLNWLHGMRLVDLPGTGGTDEVKAEYAMQQMRAADALVYLLHPRGPSADDMSNLKLLHTLGKKLLICVSQWDLAREAAARGEKLPSLESWEREIAYNSGLDCKIVPLDKFGLGLSEIFAFLVVTKSGLAELRKARANAELLPWLGNRLMEKKRELEACQLSSTREINEYSQKLLAEKEELLKLKTSAHEKRQADISRVMAQWESALDSQTEKLAEGMKNLDLRVSQPQEFEQFKSEGRELLQNSLAQLARLGRDLSENYGDFNVELTVDESLNILLPPPPCLTVADFLESGRFGALRDELESLKKQAQECAGRDEETKPEIDRQAILARIQAMELERQEIMRQPLPAWEAPADESGGSGKALGRMIGEVADLALLFIAPATFASKSASYAAKTAKAIGLGAKTAKKIGDITRQSVQAAQTAHRAMVAHDVLPPPIIQKLGILDKFTLGYWCEKIGEAFDGPAIAPPRIIDREALRERGSSLASLETELQKLRLELLASNDAKSGSPWKKQELEDAIARKEAQIRHMREKAEAEHDAATQKAELAYQQKFAFAKKRLLHAWQRSFEKQADTMGELLQSLLRNWWDGRIPALLEKSSLAVEKLLARLREIPEKKREQESLLQKHIKELEELIESLPELASDQA